MLSLIYFFLCRYVCFSDKEAAVNLDWQEDSSTAAFLAHFKALFMKRAIYGRRDQRMLICQLVLPVMLVILGLGILLIRPSIAQPEYVLSSSELNPALLALIANLFRIAAYVDVIMNEWNSLLLLLLPGLV